MATDTPTYEVKGTTRKICTWTGLITSGSEVQIRDFVEGIQNVIGPFRGTVGGTNPETGLPFPPRGNPNAWYANVRDGEDIELPGAIQVADEQEARDVCGVWAGD